MRIVGTGGRVALALFALAVPLLLFVPPLGMLCLVLAGGVLWFFRDPPRRPEAAGIVAPADGRITTIHAAEEGVRLEIFLGLRDVHVTRIPVAGTITKCKHRAGGHRPAFTKSADRNERVEVGLESEIGAVDLALVAGAVARRITTYVHAGEDVERAERLGHIAFGSRVDIELPPHFSIGDLAVARGDEVVAGETVIAPAIQQPHPPELGGT